VAAIDVATSELLLVDDRATAEREHREARERAPRIPGDAGELFVQPDHHGATRASSSAAVSASGMPSKRAGRYFIWKARSTLTVAASSSPFRGTAKPCFASMSWNHATSG